MDANKIKYTVSWTQHPRDWNISGAIKMLEIVRKQALELEHKKLEESSLKETHLLLERIRKMK